MTAVKKMRNTIQITESDERWLKKGVIRELIEKHGYREIDAVNLFNNSPLLTILHDDPENIFHHGTSYWANFLIKLINWNLFENHSCGDYDSEDDSEFQDMKKFYENMPVQAQLAYKKELYDGMVEDGTISDMSDYLTKLENYEDRLISGEIRW